MCQECENPLDDDKLFGPAIDLQKTQPDSLAAAAIERLRVLHSTLIASGVTRIEVQYQRWNSSVQSIDRVGICVKDGNNGPPDPEAVRNEVVGALMDLAPGGPDDDVGYDGELLVDLKRREVRLENVGRREDLQYHRFVL
jgi:hypothetical protein